MAQPTPTRSQTKFRLPIHVTHCASTEAIPSATATLICAFEFDPVTAYMLHHLPPEKSLDTLGIASLAELVTPGGLLGVLKKIAPSGFQQRMKSHTTATVPVKKSTFPNGENFFYVQFIDANSQHRGKGLAPALIKKL